MKWQRLSVAVRVVAGILAALMLLVAGLSVIWFFERGGSDQLERALFALISCGISGVMFGFAAITGLSPDFLAMYAAIKART